MDIENKKVLILGAWGLVGNAITRKIIKDNPSKLILTSLHEEDINAYKKQLLDEFPQFADEQIVTSWGNIFVREDFKDADRELLLQDEQSRKTLIEDVMEEMDDSILKSSSLYKLISEHKPDIIIDCINTATGIAYQDIYTAYNRINKVLNSEVSADQLREEIQRLLASIYVPQLIRHIQLLFTSMKEVNTKCYLKIGTSGTGGYGLNIPYTHSEEKPSRVLLSKSAMGGAHSMLLFLMGRTPDSAITKEIKPTAAIAWKKIGYGPIRKHGQPVEVYEVPFDKAVRLNGHFSRELEEQEIKQSGELHAVFIDTGENGVFSRGEFEAITAQGQMEFVTPEEIADTAILEIKGGNSGHDIVNALDNAALEPSYRAGFLQHSAVEKLAEFEKMHNKDSIAFEQIGPPRLSKLLIEAYLLKRICVNLSNIPVMTADELSARITELLRTEDELRNEIISIGIPILLPDGESLLRGKMVKIPKLGDEDAIAIKEGDIERWARDGWVDLRTDNFDLWINRIGELIAEANESQYDTSSMHVRTPHYWHNFEGVDIGKVVSWIFIHEEHGRRMKA